MTAARTIATLAVIAGAALAVGRTRGPLCAEFRRAAEQHDVYLLPPADKMPVLALGYDAAVADMLWAHVLVAQGLHLVEKRRYENLVRLYDAINELDPTWRTPYRYAEALITEQTVAVSFEEVLATRRILERGVANRPNDAALWLDLGAYLAYIAAPSYLDDRPELQKSWRSDGVRDLAHACEISGDDRICWEANGAGAILGREGEREAEIRLYERQYEISDDPDERAHIAKQLGRLVGERELGRATARRQAFDRLLKVELPFITDGALRALGPEPLLRCAGPGHGEPECATSWRDWQQRFDAAQSDRAR